jgi:hypothetical protein
MIKNTSDRYTVIAYSNWTSPEVHNHLTKEQADSLSWQLKSEQYKVAIELEDPLEEIGICHPID